MKKLMLFLGGFAFLLSCENKPQQYFTACPEIDVIKSANAAYVAGDWKTMRAAYADDARVYDNTWDSLKAITADDFLNALQGTLVNYSTYTIADDAVYEMIVTDDGQKWVHNWFLWKGKHKSGVDVEIPIHLSFRMTDDNKVNFQVNMYNVLPAFLADNPMPVAEASVAE